MTTVATLDTVMRLNSASFRQGMISAAAQANTSLTSIQKQAKDTASVLLSLKRAANTFGSFYLVKSGIASLIDAQKQLQAIEYTMQAATGSFTGAAEALSFVRAESDKLGLILPDSAQGFANLSASATAAGVSLKDQKELFDAYAKSSTTLHLSTEQSGRALLALEQMFAKGKIQAQELRLQLGQAIPGAAQRFQNAVMEMTKGTNLAGKSFDQLLAAGDLTTSKFLPALVTALQTSGRGWEQASTGLNANLNRVATAWFNLKTQVSSGLFNDAATAGAGLLASQLQHIATAITVIGGATIGRTVGQQLAGGASKVTRLQQEYRGARMAAAAEREYAETELATARASTAEIAGLAAKARTRDESIASTRAATIAAREQAAADFQAAAAAKLKADANVARLSGSTLPANTRFEAASRAEAAAAQKTLNAAQAKYNATLAASNALSAEADASNSARITSNLALTASEDALAVAQGRVAATRGAETALGGVAAAAGRAAKSLGTFALALVGGPWGAAIIAIGAIGYAIYSTVKASEDYRVETGNQVKSIQAMRTEVQAATADYNTLHASMSTSQTTEVFAGALTNLDKTGRELDSLRGQAEALQKAISSRGTFAAIGSLGGSSILNAIDQRSLSAVNDRIAEMSAAYRLAQGDVDGLRQKLTLFPAAVDAVTGALKGLKENASFGDIWQGIKDSFSGAPKMADELQAKISSLGASITSMGEGFAKAAKRTGQSGRAQVQEMVDERIAVAKKFGMAQKEIDKINEESALPLKQAADADAAAARKKNAEAGASAARKTAEAYASTVRSIRDRIAADQEQANSDTQITAAEKERAKVLGEMADGTLKVTAKQRAYIVSLLDQDVAIQKANKAEEERQKSLALTAALEDQLATRLQNRRDQNAIDSAGVGQGAQATQRMQDELRIRQDYQRQRDQLEKDANKKSNVGTTNGLGGDDYNARLTKIAKAQAEETALYQQGAQDKLAAESDWTNGATAALQDYQDAAANVAKQSQDVWANAMQGMEDSLVNFVTTGKLSFRSFATDILKEIARIEIRIAVSQIAGMIGGMFGSYGAAGTNSFNSAGFVSHVGGRATGGGVSANRMYEVAERGKPELLTTAGRTFLMMGNTAGSVTPTSAGSSTGGSSAPNVNVNVQVMVNSDGTASSKATSDDQRAQGKQLGDSMAAAAKQAILKEMQPNGILWKQYA